MEANSTKTNVIPHAQPTFPSLCSWFSRRVNDWHHSSGSTSLFLIFKEGLGQKTHGDVPFQLKKQHHRNFEIRQKFLLDLSQERTEIIVCLKF
jgi:hypothetical protein